MAGRVNKRLRELLSLVRWTVIISSASAVAGSQMVLHSSLPTKCATTGLVPVPTSALVIREVNLTAYLSVSHLVASEIVCASRARRNVGYVYQDGLCTIYGAVNGPYDHTVLFADLNIPAVGALEEIALYKPTYAREHYYIWTKELAVDGVFGDSMYHSQDGILQPWWIVDLMEVRKVHQVQIFTRQSCCQERLHDVEIRVGQNLTVDGDFNSFTLMSTYDGPYNSSQGHVICSHRVGVTGRFLSIQKIGVDYDHLQLVEVKVYAVKKV